MRKNFKNAINPFFGSILAVLLIASLAGCGGGGEGKVVGGGTPPTGGGVGNDACEVLGSIKREACEDGSPGETLYVCSSEGYTNVQSTCNQSPINNGNQCNGVATFETDIKPLIQKSCISCHSAPNPYTDYATAKSLGRDIVRRINLASGNIQKMPPSPRPDISAADKAKYASWANGGFLESEADCAAGGAVGTLDLKYIETEILKNLQSIDSTDRSNSRFLILAHRVNDGSSLADLEQYIFGMNKALNSISTEDDIVNADPIDPRGTIYRIDLRNYGISQGEWGQIEAGDPINIESFTTEGLLIKQLTGARKPMLHADNFSFETHGGYNASLYYNLMGIPATVNQFLADLGVNKNEQIDSGDALFAGGFGSPISINKNRIVSRFESDDGYLWETFDPIELQAGAPLAQRNFFNFPLPAEANGAAKFVFDAGEYIYSLPNGLQGYALYDSAGNRADFAPLNIVRDNETPFDPTIRNAFSCVRCHETGLIPMEDQIRNSVIQNASNFASADVDIVRQLYKSENSLSATFTKDIRSFVDAVKKVGYDPVGKPDPLNASTDRLRADVTATELSAMLFLSEDEFKVLLNQSAQGKQRIGQLLTPTGVVSFGQILDTLPILIRDFRIGQDPLGQ